MNSGPFERRGGVIFAALMPHAPILIPKVGHEKLKFVAASVAAMRVAAARLNKRNPQAVAVISPHSPRRPGAFGLWSGSRLGGSFAQFGAPETAVELPLEQRLRAELLVQARGFGLQTWDVSLQPLDHGALVPLWYLVAAGWSGPILVLSLNYPGERELTELGRAIASAAARLGQQIAIVASGDMSHRLTPNAPAGYEPRARKFDDEFIACLRRGAYRDLEQFDKELQDLAGEDALASTLVALSAVNWLATGHEVLSYEGPFGVGYGVAVLFDSEVPAKQLDEAWLGERYPQVWADSYVQTNN